MTFEELKDMAASAMSGGADEQTFGLSSKAKAQEQKALRDKYPKSAIAGRVASYVPGMFTGEGEVAAGAHALERAAPSALEGLVNAGKKVAQYNPQTLLNNASSFVAKQVPALAAKEGQALTAALARAAGRGGISALLAGQGNALVRKAMTYLPGDSGEQEPGLNGTNALMQTATGTVAGPIAHALSEAAPAIYNHPALIKRFKELSSMDTADQLRNEGVWGGKGTFMDRAQQMKSGIADLTSKLMPKLRQAEQNAAGIVSDLPPAHPDMDMFDEIPMAKKIATIRQNNRIANGAPGADPQGLTSPNMGGYAEKATNDMVGAGSAKKDAMGHAFQEEENQIPKGEYGETDLGSIEDRLKNVNTRVKKVLSDRDKGRAFGDEAGENAAERERLLAIQNAHNQTVGKAIDRFGDLGDKESYQGARQEYRQGADLESGLNDYERGEAGAQPHIGRGQHGFMHSAINKTIGALPVRTGLGVLLNGLSPEMAGVAVGRGDDYHERAAANAPADMDPAQSFQHFQEKVPGIAPVQQAVAHPDQNPYLDAINKPADQQDSSGNPYLDAISQ